MIKHTLFATALATITLAFVPAASGQHEHDSSPAASSAAIPRSLDLEHEKLHTELNAVIALGGRTGAAAKRVADLLHDHFASEQAFALPPLGMLRPLANGERPTGARAMIALANRLRAELPRMLQEHKAILAALNNLARESNAEQQPSGVAFAEALTLHAQHEEEVLYPAAILVGRYLETLALPSHGL